MKILNKLKYFLLAIPVTALAVGGAGTDPGTGGGGTFVNPLSVDNFGDLIAVVLKALVDIGVVVLVVFIVWAGFQFVTAQGNATKIEDAKKALFWAVIGGAVLLGAQIIAHVIQGTVKAL